MTIDERLERLTERHEALTESVEILTSDLHALQTLVGTLARATRGLQKDNSRLDNLVTGVAEGTARLLRVAKHTSNGWIGWRVGGQRRSVWLIS